jgi:peroxiredoxin
MVHILFALEFARLVESETITDEALQHFFASSRHILHAGESAYGTGAQAFKMFVYDGDKLFARLTPEQQAFYIKAFGELVEESEKVENEWIAAGKRMGMQSELPGLQAYLGRLQLPGKEITLTGTTLDGDTFDLQSLRGRIVLLVCWATWCAPCIAELPNLKECYDGFHARGFEIVGISIDAEGDRDKLADFVESRQLPWIQLHDPKRELHTQLHGLGVPYHLLLDRDGKVVMQNARGEGLKQKLDEMFAEK